MDILKEAERIARDGIHNERDLAIGIEIMQEHHDRLEELEESDFSHLFDDGVQVSVEGSNVRFGSIDEFADFAVGVMYR